MQSSAKPSLEPNWVHSFLEKHGNGSPILLAVSGGLDSMVLWDLIEKTGLPYGVAHVNYHLRAVESDADAQLVTTVAVERDTTLHLLNDHSISKGTKGLQARAREVRYRFFSTLASTYSHICTAHHADDQVETVLMQLGRGGGPSALAGIAATGTQLLRPLLPFSKKALAAYAKTNQITFREDLSNASDDYLRNRVRHHLLPLADQLMDGFRQNLTKAACQQQALLSFSSAMVSTILPSMRSNRWPHTLDRDKLLRLPGLSYFLHELLKTHGFLPETLNAIVAAIEDGKGQKRLYLNQGESIQLVLTGRTLHLEQTKAIQSFALAIDAPGVFESPLGKLVVKEVDDTHQPSTFTEDELWLSELCDLTWRTTLETDTIGLIAGKNKAAKRVLAEAKLPNLSQGTSSILLSNEHVLWMVGERKCSSLKTNEAKTAGYHLRFIKPKPRPGIVEF